MCRSRSRWTSIDFVAAGVHAPGTTAQPTHVILPDPTCVDRHPDFSRILRRETVKINVFSSNLIDFHRKSLQNRGFSRVPKGSRPACREPGLRRSRRRASRLAVASTSESDLARVGLCDVDVFKIYVHGQADTLIMSESCIK